MNRFMKMMMKKSNPSNPVREKRERSAEPIFVPNAVEKTEEVMDYSPEFAKVNTNLEKINQTVSDAKTETLECIHNENVKVYRNVQAVIVEENKKAADSIKETVHCANDSLTKKINLAMLFAILAFAFSLLHLVFDVFSCIL